MAKKISITYTMTFNSRDSIIYGRYGDEYVFDAEIDEKPSKKGIDDSRVRQLNISKRDETGDYTDDIVDLGNILECEIKPETENDVKVYKSILSFLENLPPIPCP